MVKTQISRANRPADVLGGMLRNGETHLKASCHTGKATGERGPLDPRRPSIVTDGCACGLRATHRLELWWLFSTLDCFGNQLGIASRVFSAPRERRLHRLGSLDTSRAHQLSREIRICCTQGIVRLFMQVHTVATCGFKAGTCNHIKALGMLCQRAMQDLCLR